jgi:hypothetical protein
MKSTFFILIGLCLFASCKNDPKSSSPTTVIVPAVSPAPAPPTAPTIPGTCYILAEWRDTTMVHLVMEGDAVTGHMSWAPWQKDGAHGALTGKVTNGEIVCIWLLMIEGSVQSEEVIFKVEGDKLLRLEGPLATKGDLAYIKDRKKAKWSTILTQIDCVKVAAQIGYCEDTAQDIANQKE